MSNSATLTLLADRILAIVAGNPGITTNVLCREVKVRKSDVLAELGRLEREQLLRFDNGPRGSKCWYVVAGRGNQFPTCSRGMSAASSDAASFRVERDHRSYGRLAGLDQPHCPEQKVDGEQREAAS